MVVTKADQSRLLKLAAAEALDRRVAEAAINEVRAAIRRWHDFAEQAKVPALKADERQSSMKV